MGLNNMARHDQVVIKQQSGTSYRLKNRLMTLIQITTFIGVVYLCLK